MSNENIRVFHQPRNHYAHGLNHQVMLHNAQFDGVPQMHISVDFARSIVEELDRLQEIEHEYNAMVAEQDARRI